MSVPFSVRLISAAATLCSVSTVGLLAVGFLLALIAFVSKGVENLGYLPMGWGMRHMGTLEAMAAILVAPLAVWAGIRLYRHAVAVERALSEAPAADDFDAPKGTGPGL
ncbi:MAG: hypothetical protein RIB59_13295 [Rhodospirillales bacterium]